MSLDINKEIDRMHELQETLIFEEFNSDTAWILGNMLYKRAKEENKVITISIVLNGHKLFYYSFEGTSPDNDQWIVRKENTVKYFFKSSYETALLMKIKKDSLTNRYGLPAEHYAAAGGSVPIIINNTGVVGTITVSGMAQEEDHYFVTDIIEEYLKKISQQRFK
ncbi:MAG: heme-degrading domain-containing protein [Clostridiaceae bacterium]